MQFNTNKELSEAAETIRAEAGSGRKHYPILFKKALCEYMNQHNYGDTLMADMAGITCITVNTWQQQYAEGLYTLEGAYCVSKKSLSLNQKLIKQLKQQVADIDVKILLIKQCEAAGITVSM